MLNKMAGYCFIALILSITLIGVVFVHSNRANASELPILLGIYPWGNFQESLVQIQAMDEWAGVGNSLAATFMNIDDPQVVTILPAELNTAWSAGYTPFINLAPSHPKEGESCPAEQSAVSIVEGSLDPQISIWAEAFRDWSVVDPSRRAFIAPLQEMNGYWVCYGLDPINYRKAFVHIQEIFASVGVPDDKVSWVFAPNGWSDPSDPPFEEYYPGNTFVDVVSFSAYNWGACSPYPADDWRSPQVIFEPFLDRLRILAPGKPIIIAETGTTSMRQDGSVEDKDGWLEEAYTYLATYEAFRGVLYFNIDEQPANPEMTPCDFPIFRPPDVPGYDGYKNAVNNPSLGYAYSSPTELGTLAFQRPDGVFEDVWPTHPLAGIPEVHWSRQWVETLAESGITSGCRVEILLPERDSYSAVELRYYCPLNTVTRAQMAIFLERGIRGAGFTPPQATGVFGDVSIDHWAAAWIEQLAADGITSGCSVDPPMYCPESSVTRAQMAVFLERAKHWPNPYIPPPATGTKFNDVPADHWAAAWIEQLATDGITGGCSTGPPLYCPENPVTRAQMAIFLVRVFELPIE